MDRRQFRSLLFRIHTWLGLHLCLLLGLIFATGTLLLFSPELKEYARPQVWVSPAASEVSEATVGEIYDALIAKDSIDRIEVIGSSPRPWFGRVVRGSGPDGRFVAHVDVHTAEILGYGSGSRLRQTIRTIHDTLLFPIVSVAHVVVNFLSFVVLAMVVTGLITYRRFWKGFFRLPRRDMDQRGRRGAWHRLIGVWTAPFLLASAIASSVFFANAIGFQPTPMAAKPVAERADRLPAGFDGAALDRLVSECRAILPEFMERGVQLPWDNKQGLRINGIDEAVSDIFGNVSCHIDPSGAEAPQIVRASDGNLWAKINLVAVAVHYGFWGGWYSLVLWLIGGTGSVFLALTGAQVYASRVGESGKGTLSTVIAGLGILKWGYALLVLGMFAVVVAKAVL